MLGKEDGVPKTPAWASEKCGVSEWTIKALARDWANKVTSLIHGNGGPAIRGPYSSEPARLEVMLLGMSGLGKPGVHQAKMLEWNIWRKWLPLPYQGVVRPDIPMFAEQVRPAGGMGDPTGCSASTGDIPSWWLTDPWATRRCRPSPSASCTTPSSTRLSAGGDSALPGARGRSSSPSTPSRPRAAPRST